MPVDLSMMDFVCRERIQNKPPQLPASLHQETDQQEPSLAQHELFYTGTLSMAFGFHFLLTKEKKQVAGGQLAKHTSNPNPNLIGR